MHGLSQEGVVLPHVAAEVSEGVELGLALLTSGSFGVEVFVEPEGVLEVGVVSVGALVLLAEREDEARHHVIHQFSLAPFHLRPFFSDYHFYIIEWYYYNE